MEDLNEAGGVSAVMSELNKIGLLDTSCMTVTGKTIAENIQGVVNKNPEVIRLVENPYSKTGGIAVLKGNLAPDSAVVKRSVRKMQLQQSKAERSWKATWLLSVMRDRKVVRVCVRC